MGTREVNDNEPWPHVAEDEVNGDRFLWDNDCPAGLRAKVLEQLVVFLTEAHDDSDKPPEPEDLIMHMVSDDDDNMAEAPCVFIYSRDGCYRGRYYPRPEFKVIKMDRGPFAGKEVHLPDFRDLDLPPKKPH